MEGAGVALGSVSLFFQVYDVCRRLYSGYENLRHFGKDMALLLARLQLIEFDFDTLMVTKTSDLLKPPDVDNQHHPETSKILLHLRVILTQFKNCNKIIATTFEHSGWIFSVEDGSISQASGTSQTPSLLASQTTATNTDSAFTPTLSNTSSGKGHLKVVKFFRSLSPRRSSSKSRETSNMTGPPLSTQNSTAGSTTQTLEPTSTRSTSSPPVPSITVEGEPVNPFSMLDETTIRLRAEAGWWTMVKWADHNKTALETEIDRLRDRVRDFRQTLELRAPLGPERVLDIDSTAAHADYVPRMPPDALLEVHEALKSINRRSLEPASFSLSIAESCESNRRAITDFPSMESALMPRSNVFLLQKQESNTESTLMIVEGFSTDTTNLQEPPRLVNAESIVRPARCDTVANYVSCGFVASVGRNDIEHQVFVETQAWVTSGTFSDLLEQGQTQALLTPPKLVEVFETILIAYLDFEKVRNYCRYPRLEDYKTYLHPQYRDDLNIAETSTDLTWRVPYLSCGLGTPQPRRIPGASKEDREPDEAVIRLGLVLFQLGSHSKEILIPDAAASVKPWRTLKLEALNRFHEVTNICGLALANVVEACLLANARTEKKTVISCLSKLENLKTLKTLLSN